MNYISPKEEVLQLKRWPKDTIAAGRGHTVALKSDGTVVAVGRNKEGECNVSSWCDIEAVAAAMFIWRRTQVMLIQSVSHVTALR